MPRRPPDHPACRLGIALLALALAAPASAQAPVAAGVAPAAPAAVRAAILHLPALDETDTRHPALKERPHDPWLGLDKAQHAAFLLLWTLGSQYVLVNKAGWTERRALPFSVTSSALLGLSKEVYDWKAGPRRYFSPRDLAADAFGTALAVGLILL